MWGYKNYSEELVKEMLSKILDDYPTICKCDKCIADIMTLSLNSVKPKYVLTEKGMIYTKALNEIDKQEKISIAASIIKSIEKVSSNPNH